MKVYIIGAHAVGKTTLARFISTYYNLPLLPEVARMILSEKELHLDSLRYDMDAVDNYQKNVFERQVHEEKKQVSFVSDRSALDVLAYSAQHTRILSDLMQHPELTPYVASLKSPDAILFFVRPSKATLKADGVRESINWDGVVAIDAMVKFLIQMFDLKYFSINTDNMQERVQLINSALKLHSN